jgi:transcriptional regulator with XRE-family HTH domain
MANVNIQTAALLATRRAKELGLSQMEIAKATGHSQAQVSRALGGHTSPRSKTFQDVCTYVLNRSPGEHRASVARNPELIDALAAVWDGTAEHSAALACVIRSLATLNRRI